jgi:Na+/proline symporter
VLDLELTSERFLYMTAELSALGQIVESLTGMNGLPVMIVQAVITTIYTSLGGFKVSFITDNIQGAMVIGLSKRPSARDFHF